MANLWSLFVGLTCLVVIVGAVPTTRLGQYDDDIFARLRSLEAKLESRIGRRPGYQGPRCSTSSTVDSGKSARKKKKTTTDNCTLELSSTEKQLTDEKHVRH
ncbi:hypothetical protein NP493_1504g00054 [Ridgeia piscesae]|uniref:Uncharacterized protein n=1 Tax=Ridgeia piscesae TaxID=27915 RepID=A0AAD9K104_RIDPI|nr:hypothetical protein NP493_1504g00054 [Ridgeia piscesae]